MIKSVLIIMASVVAINCVGIYESTYTRNAEVTKVLNESLVTFTDDTGNDWDYYFECRRKYDKPMTGEEVDAHLDKTTKLQ